MPWGLYWLGLAVVYLLQTAVLPHFAPEWLDLLLVLALFCGLTAPIQEARLAGWCTGFAQDIGSTGPLGLHAVALGLAVYALTHIRELVNRELWWVRWLIAFFVAFPARLLLQLHLRYFQAGSKLWSEFLIEALVSAAVAALLAAVLPGLPRLFGRRPRRRRYTVPRWNPGARG